MPLRMKMFLQTPRKKGREGKKDLKLKREKGVLVILFVGFSRINFFIYVDFRLCVLGWQEDI